MVIFLINYNKEVLYLYFIFRIKSILSKSGKLDNKVKRIGPHIEIFQVFRERTKFVNIKKVVKMVILMQAYVRGWLERKRFQRIMVKVKHGLNIMYINFLM